MGPRFHWRLFVSEMIGTALLVLGGLSLVIVMFGTGSPMAQLIPSEGLRRLITGFLFGTTGAAIALSKVGEVSGAHINPAVTLTFRLMGKLDLADDSRIHRGAVDRRDRGIVATAVVGRDGQERGLRRNNSRVRRSATRRPCWAK